MNTQQAINYKRIASAIDYISRHFKEQPNLDEVARETGLSPYHFQRLFTEWAGVSPKKFLQYLSLTYSKQLLKEKEMTLFEAASEAGLSGTGRLHDLFVNIEGMTPGEFKSGGNKLQINYSFADTLFGAALVASTSKGVCHLAFTENKQEALNELKQSFPNAILEEQRDVLQDEAFGMFMNDVKTPKHIKLHLRGTDFQLKVWEALLKIPMGQLTSYGHIATLIGSPNASRAVGSAVGDNPVAFLIPCHRVIRSSGIYGDYRWGSTRKQLMIGWEGAQTENMQEQNGSVA